MQERRTYLKSEGMRALRLNDRYDRDAHRCYSGFASKNIGTDFVEGQLRKEACNLTIAGLFRIAQAQLL